MLTLYPGKTFIAFGDRPQIAQISGTLIPLVESVRIGTKGICGQKQVRFSKTRVLLTFVDGRQVYEALPPILKSGYFFPRYRADFSRTTAGGLALRFAG